MGGRLNRSKGTTAYSNVMSIGAIMAANHSHLVLLRRSNYSKPNTAEPFVHLMHNNCQRVHLLLAQSHLSRHFMRIPPPTQIISVVTAFCGFHISPRHFSGGTTTQLCVVLVSSHSTLPAVLTLSYLSRLPMVLVVPGSCRPEVRQFVPRDILTTRIVTLLRLR